MADEDRSDQWGAWRGRMAASRRRRDDRISEWQENVDRRKGESSHRGDGSATTSLLTQTSTVSTNQDAPLTKAKITQMYSQTPEVRLSPRFPQFQQAVPLFAREINDTIEAASVGSTIEENLCDVVNAAGIAGVLVSCETRTEPKEVPLVDPATVPPEMQGALPTMTVDQPVDIRYLVQRISPADLLIPDDFTGSNYDQARWLGEDGRMTWAQGKTNLGLTDDVKEKVLGQDKRAGSGGQSSLNTDTTNLFRDTDVVNYTQVFYWRHFYHADETRFAALQRLVFVEGLEEPVVNEEYRAQKRQPDGSIVGVILNPIRVLTLTYISDDAMPPSDSSISRGQVAELTDSRNQMMDQRKHSIPLRGGDVNRISHGARSKIEAGNFQDFIWTNGPGDRAIWQVAPAQFPPEKFEFDRIIKNEIAEQWQVGTNQTGAFASGERSAREAGIIERNFQRRVGQEQDKVTKYFLGIAKVLAGHLAIYGQFKLPDQLGVAREALATGFTYSVRVDSTVRLDAQQRIDQLKEFYNLTAQTGYINPKFIVQEWADLIDAPQGTVVDPQPKPPEPVKVSVSKAEDLQDPIFLALLMRTQQGPLPEDLTAAIKMLMTAQGVTAPPEPGAPADGGVAPTDVQTPEIRNPEMETAPRIERRAADGGA